MSVSDYAYLCSRALIDAIMPAPVRVRAVLHSVGELNIVRARMQYVGLLRQICHQLAVGPEYMMDLIFGRHQVVQTSIRTEGHAIAVSEVCLSDATLKVPNMRACVQFLISIAGRLDALADTIEALPPSDTRTTCMRFYIFIGNWMCWLADERIGYCRREFESAGKQIARATEPRTRALFEAAARATEPQTAVWLECAAALTAQLRPQLVRSLTPAAVANWMRQEPWQHIARTTLEYVHMTKLELHASGDALLLAIDSLRRSHSLATQTSAPAKNFELFKENMRKLDSDLTHIQRLLPVSAAGWFEPPPGPLNTRQLIFEWTDRCIGNFRQEQFDKQTVSRASGELMLFHLADGAIGHIVECLRTVQSIKKEKQFLCWVQPVGRK